MLRFEVLTAMKMSVLVFCVVTPCGLVGRYQHSGLTLKMETLFLQNVSIDLQVQRALQPRRQTLIILTLMLWIHAILNINDVAIVIYVA
jgi:hypothetical protein